jgi:hypothetical protein
MYIQTIEKGQEPMYLETHRGDNIYLDRSMIRNATRAELQEWLELRGSAVYDHESTELLRECLLDDYENEMA